MTRFAITKPGELLGRHSFAADAKAGLVIGTQSVPSGLASGVLAGVNPLAGLYAGMFGTLGGVLFTGTALMGVQATGAMAVIVADAGLDVTGDPLSALYTLTVLTGLIMVLAGVLRAGRLLRFVSHSVMTGFVAAIGVSIILGQLDNATGYASAGSHRLLRTLDLLIHPGRVHLPTLTVAVLTAGLIIVLQRTALGALGMVVATVAGSAAAAAFSAAGRPVALVSGIADIPAGLPTPVLPALDAIPALLIPAVSLAFVGLVQGAGVSAGMASGSQAPGRVSQDFIGQGTGNILSGLLRGMPVGGSMSTSSLAVSAGAGSRAALLYATVTMVVLVLFAAPVIGLIAMPSLAAMLIVAGFGTIRPRKIKTVAGAGRLPATVMAVTFALTLLIPLQYAVLAGAGISAIVFVAQQAGGLRLRRIRLDGRSAVETEPPEVLPAGETVILQPYGAIFYASAATLRQLLPQPDDRTAGAVVILRLRGADDAGATLLRELAAYARTLRDADSKLVIVTDNPRLLTQLRQPGIIDDIGERNLYPSTRTIWQALRHATTDADQWITERRAAA